MVGDGASVGSGWELDSTPWFDGVFSCVTEPFFLLLFAHKKTPHIFPGFVKSFLHIGR